MMNWSRENIDSLMQKRSRTGAGPIIKTKGENNADDR